MSSRLAYYFGALAVILAHSHFVSVQGQCTIIEGCENGDPSMSIEEEIQKLRVDLFEHVNKHVKSIQDRLTASLQQSQNTRRLANGEANHDCNNGNHLGICGPTSEVCDCSDIKASGHTASGVYEVCARHKGDHVCSDAYCDMETADNTSLVFQRRKDGRVNFYRTWAEYKDGFGDLNGEFWLGNEMLYLLTSKRNYKLRIDLGDFEGNKRFAEYDRFSISSSVSNYTLKVDGYSGNAGDSLTYHSGEQFSTKDVDNDKANSSTSCAVGYEGAWWYRSCHYSNLNGVYYGGNQSDPAKKGAVWIHWLGRFYSLKSTEMKLVPVT